MIAIENIRAYLYFAKRHLLQRKYNRKSISIQPLKEFQRYSKGCLAKFMNTSYSLIATLMIATETLSFIILV